MDERLNCNWKSCSGVNASEVDLQSGPDVRMHSHIHTHMHVLAQVSTHWHNAAHTCTYTHACTYTLIHTHAFTHVRCTHARNTHTCTRWHKQCRHALG